jgi:hypothetical protein
LHAQTFSSGSASLGPLEFTVVDLRPGDGVMPSYSLDGQPDTRAYVSFDGNMAGSDTEAGWDASVAVENKFGTAGGNMDGYAVSTGPILARFLVSFVKLASTFPSVGYITVTPGTALTITATTAVSTFCASGVGECFARGTTNLALWGPDGSTISDDHLIVYTETAGAKTGSDLLSVSYANLMDTPAYLTFEASAGVEVFVPNVAEPSTVLLSIAGLVGLASVSRSRGRKRLR